MKIVLASNNAGKLAELQTLFAPLGMTLVRQSELNIPEAAEPFKTFVENALAKARHAAQLSGLPALADDAGLCVDAFGGQPGVDGNGRQGDGRDARPQKAHHRHQPRRRGAGGHRKRGRSR